jgi:hypothetical protein
MIRTLKNITFNEAVIVTSMNVRSFSEKTTTFTTFTEITEIIENASNINDADIANINDTNIIFENIENTPFENITVEPAPVRRSTRYRKATFKIVEINTVVINIVEVAEAPTISTNNGESEEEDYLPKIIIIKIIIANEDKPTYEKAMADSEKS